MIEKTLSIIKPDAVKRKLTGEILSRLEKEGFEIVAQKRLTLRRPQAEAFYREHAAKPFFEGLVDFMISGAIMVQVLQKENAVLDYRVLMGATNPAEADEGTLRKQYATSIGENCVHGSDNIESARREISFFFSELEIIHS